MAGFCFFAILICPVYLWAGTPLPFDEESPSRCQLGRIDRSEAIKETSGKRLEILAQSCVLCILAHMDSKTLIKKLKSEGWINVGGKGDHEKFKHPTKPGHVVIPHPRKGIAIGTLRNIYRQAGWTWR